MTGRMYVWPALLAAAALFLAVLLLFVVQPSDEEVSGRIVPVTSDPRPAEHGDTEGYGFVSARSISPAREVSSLPTPLNIDTPAGEAWDPMLPSWHTAINQLLDSEDDNHKVVADLAALVPTLPMEGQIEAVQHMVSLLENAKYGLAANMLVNSATHTDLQKVLFSDVLERPNSVKLRVLVKLIGIPGHPYRAAARRELREALGADFDHDPVLWKTAVRAFLAREAEAEFARGRHDMPR